MLTDELIKGINAISVAAGDEIMAIYAKDFEVYDKSDSSPLTEADLAANQVIVDSLRQISDFPILSEESADIDWAERKSWTSYWLVDPLDGTKEFIKKNGEFTVNIALIHNGYPIFGVVYAPVQDKCFWGAEGFGAFVESGGKVQTLNVVTEFSTPTKVVGSRSHPSPDMQAYLSRFEEVEMVPMGSSLKFCAIAEGVADIYPRLGPTSEWDTGAAQAVLEQAGGQVINYETNSRLQYNTKESFLNPYFIATSEKV